MAQRRGSGARQPAVQSTAQQPAQAETRRGVPVPTRPQTVERLRLWAQRAQHEAVEADTLQNAQNWQGQSQVLAAVATFLASQPPEVPDTSIWRRVVADRERTVAEWFARQGPEESNPGEAAFYAGAVAGYDLALTALKDIPGRIWPRFEPHVG